MQWNGLNVSVPDNSLIGTGLGYSIASMLRRQHLNVEEVYQQEELVDWLIRGGLVAIAGYEEELRPILNNHPEYARVKKLTPRLHRDVMYLVINNTYYENHTALVEKIWNTLGEMHANGTYDKFVAEYRKIESD